MLTLTLGDGKAATINENHKHQKQDGILKKANLNMDRM